MPFKSTTLKIHQKSQKKAGSKSNKTKKGAAAAPATPYYRSTRGSQKRKMKRSIKNAEKSHIVKIFFEMLNTIKLYHWKTRSYSQHKATDELYSKMNEHIDSFIEVLLGKDESRIQMIEKKIDLLDSTNTTDFKNRIYEYREFLIEMNQVFDSRRDTDLLNIRDEILGDMNQFLYLLTFDK
jgi:DNA-binding ferritin-like protein